MHWDGNDWSQVDFPAGVAVLTDVSGSALDDVWAVGADATGSPIMAHWDGTTWTLS